MKAKLHLDDIIYRLQKNGGVSTYWKELTSRITKYEHFEIKRTITNKIARFLPVFTNYNIFHSSYYRIAISPKTKNVVTIHDFIDELGINNDKKINSKLNSLQMKLVINYADAIVCISERTKKDLLSLYPNCINHSSIYVIGHGTSLKFDKELNSKPPARLLNTIMPMTKKYILFVGKRIKYKNFESAILGFSESCLPKMGFSMVCVGSKFSELENKLFSSLNLQNSVIAFENATEQELNYLYQNALALIYPSLYEGFGLPPLEALSCGCPVIASNISAIPEVVGDAGILINPLDTTSIGSAMEKLLCEKTRNIYINKGFARAKLYSWEQASQKYIEVYRNLANFIK